jgi:glycosyltransferase involved in cell wall biosynthesis
LQSPLRSASAIAAIGSGAAEAYRRLFPDTPVHNIPYFCDLAPFADATRHRATASTDVTVLFSGQLIHRKGVDILVDAFVRAAGAVPALRLHLTGSGPDRATLEGRIPPGLRDRVVFLGHKDPADLPGIFAQADIFVLPSRHDGWGVVVNEALGAGLPIIASDAVGAARDLVAHEENGLLVRRGDADDLSVALARLGSSSGLRRRFASASRDRAERWGLEEGVRRWEAVIRDITTTQADERVLPIPSTIKVSPIGDLEA